MSAQGAVHSACGLPQLSPKETIAGILLLKSAPEQEGLSPMERGLLIMFSVTNTALPHCTTGIGIHFSQIIDLKTVGLSLTLNCFCLSLKTMQH